ncbi:50S ribosomal protein L35 [Candidatus Parcubacteria bacterium]|nr:50S ribosomal protein L35 [Candidatus Parcubacteria bacterium]
MKTNKTALKRFKISSKGKLQRRVQGVSHLRRKETSGNSNRKRRLTTVSKGFAKKIIKVLGKH